MRTVEERERTAARVTLRRTTADDGAALWRMAKESGALDLNSPYAYLMWADLFAATSVVAEVDGEPAGFVMGFRVPGREHVLFVWQVAVAEASRGLGIAGRMLDELVAANEGVTAVEATVTPSNDASRRLFQSLADRHGCTCTEAPHYRIEHFPLPNHEAEPLLHIGPLASNQ